MPGTQNPVTVDGVSLDSYAWNIDSKVRPWAGTVEADEKMPGDDGEVASLDDDLEPTVMTLSMWAQGTDDTGAVPGGTTAMMKVRDNLDQLSHLFSRRNRLMDVREVVDSSGTLRQAMCKRIDISSPKVEKGGFARFIVALKIPSGLLQDVATADWSSTPTIVSGNYYEITPLQGSSGPINDAIILVTGPVTNPKLVDYETGAWVQLNAALTGGQFWRLNMETWSTRYGASLSLSSLDTDGTSGDGITSSGGGNARFLRLQPSLITGLRRVQIALAGTGFTSATGISVRARRKFLQ
jgi:hypothetical protein